MAKLILVRAAFVALVALSSASENEHCAPDSAVCANHLTPLAELDATSLLSVRVDLHKKGKGDKADHWPVIKLSDPDELRHAVLNANEDVPAATLSGVPIGDGQSLDFPGVIGDVAKDVAKGVLEETAAALQESKSVPDDIVPDVAGDVAKAVVEKVTGALTNEATDQLVSALKKKLGDIKKAVEHLQKQCKGYVDNLLKHISASEATMHSKATALENEGTSTLKKFVSEWSKITNMISESSGVVTAVLSSAGQHKLAKTIKDIMKEGLSDSVLVKSGVAKASDIMADLPKMTDAKIKKGLAKLKQLFQLVKQQAKEVVKSLDHAFSKIFHEMITAIVKAVPGTNQTELKASFDHLHTMEKSIISTLASSFESLFSGIDHGVKLTTAQPQQQHQQQHKNAGERTSASVGISVLAIAMAGGWA